MYRKDLTTPETEWFFKAILSLKTEEDCARGHNRRGAGHGSAAARGKAP